MLTILAATLPMCYFAVATDAPNPEAVYKHETWHCWGCSHPVHAPKTHFDKNFRAAIAPWYYRIKGEYPNKVVYFDTGKNIAKVYCNGNVYGCQWFE